MNPSPPAALALSFTADEASRLPIKLLFDLARHMAETLGRRADALEIVRSTPFESAQAAPLAPGQEPPRPNRYDVQHNFFWAVFIASMAGGADGVAAVLAALAKRSAGARPDFEPLGSAAAEPMEPFQISGQQILDELLKTDKVAAALLLREAPDWVCLQGGITPGALALASDRGMGLALSGNMPPDLVELYWSRQGFAAGFAAPPAQDHAGPWRLKSAAKFLAQEFQWGKKNQDGSKSPVELLLDQTIAAARQKPLPLDLSQSPLPEGWVGSIAFGVHEGADSALESWLGRERMDALCAAEIPLKRAWRLAFQSGREQACERALRVHGARAMVDSWKGKLTPTAVAMAAEALDAAAFGRLLRQAHAQDPQAVEESCSVRFWAFVEGSARKMGDALAFCAAKGLAGHAKELLATMPHLPRKDVNLVLNYIESRDVSFKGRSRAAWEDLLLGEVAAAPAPTRAKASSRL
jgi:hypothetical protein